MPGCGGVVSSANWGPGYYEARMMAGSSWSTFWVQGIGGDCTAITAGVEADVLETNPTWAPSSQHALHWSGYGSCAQSSSKNPLGLSPSSFHVIGMDWSTVRGMTFYVDGVQSYSVPSATPANTAQIRFTMEGVCNATVPMAVDWFCYFKEM
jgi:hypothetical protein